MIRASLSLLAACLLATPAVGAARENERVWTVREVAKNAAALDGKKIVIRGRLERCYYLSCGLIEVGTFEGEQVRFYLSIGSDKEFDRQAASRLPSYVEMRVKVRNVCVTDPETDIITACGDRPGTLKPIKVLAWTADSSG